MIRNTLIVEKLTPNPINMHQDDDITSWQTYEKNIFTDIGNTLDFL